MERCPTAGQLERWLRQPGPGGESEELARHVDGCPRCQQALDALAAGGPAPAKPQFAPTVDDPALNRLKDARPTTDHPDRPLVPAPASGAQPRLEEETRRLLLRRLRVEPRTWEAFRLTALEGLSGAEAARRTGLRASHVYVARFRVQEMLREEVQKLDQGA